jgi:4-aminobutyrate aminotransferase-like enzyme
LDIGGYYKNVITLAPSLDISYAEIEQGLCALEVVVVRAKRELADASSRA